MPDQRVHLADGRRVYRVKLTNGAKVTVAVLRDKGMTELKSADAVDKRGRPLPPENPEQEPTTGGKAASTKESAK